MRFRWVLSFETLFLCILVVKKLYILLALMILCVWSEIVVFVYKVAKERLKQVITQAGERDFNESCSDQPLIDNELAGKQYFFLDPQNHWVSLLKYYVKGNIFLSSFGVMQRLSFEILLLVDLCGFWSGCFLVFSYINR